jgi:hypothetical protein
VGTNCGEAENCGDKRLLLILLIIGFGGSIYFKDYAIYGGGE